jgi:hypothetical protein
MEKYGKTEKKISILKAILDYSFGSCDLGATVFWNYTQAL